MTDFEKKLVLEVLESGQLGGDGPFTKRCTDELEALMPKSKVFLVQSCTAALEMAALLADLKPGDEVIMPSYTFVSTANAFVLRGVRPVFVDIRPDTLNLDENLIEAAITPQTKAVVPVHYAGTSCNMQAINTLARDYHLLVIEDAAQGFDAYYQGKPLGTLGAMGAFSFHETKNLTSGEGGLLAINHPEYMERAQVMRDKGTNRTKFIEGTVDKYTWVDVGSSYAPSELTAALVFAQIRRRAEIHEKRKVLWERYQDGFRELVKIGKVASPHIPDDCTTNYHIFYLIPGDSELRATTQKALREAGYSAPFHYTPLHTSSYGLKVGRASGNLPQTQRVARGLMRLPLFVGLGLDQVDEIIEIVYRALGTASTF
jgi:dTDP-4-amino-4,6-dideoxygalactose transaminase